VEERFLIAVCNKNFHKQSLTEVLAVSSYSIASASINYSSLLQLRWRQRSCACYERLAAMQCCSVRYIPSLAFVCWCCRGGCLSPLLL